MDEPAEVVTAADLVDGWSVARLGRLGLERAVRPFAVVVVDIDVEDALEVAATEDQQPVKTLGSYGADEAFGDRVRLR